MAESVILSRACQPGLKVTIAAGATGLSESIDIRQMAGGGVRIPDNWVTADLSFVVSHLDDSAQIRHSATPPDPVNPQSLSYVPLRHGGEGADAGDLVKVTGIDADASWIPLPAELFMFGFFKFRSTTVGAETVVNQTTAPVLFVALKG